MASAAERASGWAAAPLHALLQRRSALRGLRRAAAMPGNGGGGGAGGSSGSGNGGGGGGNGGGSGRRKDDDKSRSRKGSQFEKGTRRRGRPAWQRSPDDTPLRDGNRDRLYGLLTERAVRTLLVYLQELNVIHFQWLLEFYRAHEIPLQGQWDEVSGDAFLRTLLQMPVQSASFRAAPDPIYNNMRTMGVDPRK